MWLISVLASPTITCAGQPVTNSIGMSLVRIEPGTFTMGQDGPPVEDYLGQKRLGEMYKDIDRIDYDEKPAHRVTITQPFLIGATEVTVAHYRQFDPDFAKRDVKAEPAESVAAAGVTWERAVAFCEWLSQREGKPYRLPTEAEWEYACRAGTTTLFNTGDTLPDGHQKWFGEGNFRSAYLPDPMPREYDWRKTGPVSRRVAEKTPNAWGLHDMHGNVAEWCLDWHGPYEAGDQTDPVGRLDGDCRVFRGGFHSSLVRFLRSANRGSWVQNSPSQNIGFRVVQGEMPKGTPLPVAPPPLHARDVRQTPAALATPPSDEPFFSGPKPFVRVPPEAVGPVYASQNHSPAITECPNGDLLAVWFSTLGETGLETANAAARLRAGAEQWEPASGFWDAMDVNDHAPKVWWDGDRTIYHIVEARGHGDGLVRHSTDNGATWSKAAVFCDYGETSGNPIRTREGVIAVPFDWASLVVSRDDGKTWARRGRPMQGPDDAVGKAVGGRIESTAAAAGGGGIRPGGSGPFIAGLHAPIVELADGRLLAFSRLEPSGPFQERFHRKMPMSHSSDLGVTWQWEESEFPVVSSVQRPAMLRLREGPIVLCSFTDEHRTPFKDRKGMTFASTAGDYTGFGLFAAVSYDDGTTWPDRRLLAPPGKHVADGYGYLAATQSRDGMIQLITSQNHYTFNLAWVKAKPPAPPGRPVNRKSSP